MRKEAGFTLIELMIVVAILSILVALALSVYQDSVAKAQLTEAIGIADGLKTDVGEYYVLNGSCPTLGNGAFSPGTSYRGRYVSRVAVTTDADNCVITAYMLQTTISPPLRGKTVTLETNGQTAGTTQWICSSNVLPKYVPIACR